MADVNISKYRASVVRDGSKPASPGFVVSEGQDPVNPPGTNNYVPYTGATANVELGEFGLEAGFVTLDTTPTNIPTDQGAIYWDDTRSTAALIMNGTLQHIGQDSFFYVKNSSGSTIPKGTCVGFAGTEGGSGHLLITPFLANGSVPSTYFMGVTCESIANGSFGQVMHFGELTGINTSGFTAGALLYASSTVAGGFQTTAPVAPNNIILVAAAVNSKNNGAIVVRPTLGSNINTDEGVKITSPTTGDLLQLQAGGLWENKTLSQVIGSAYVPSTRTLTINGTALDLSVDRSWSVGDMLLNTYQVVTGTKVFGTNRLIMEGEGTAQPTSLSNTQTSNSALASHNSFGFNGSNNIYFNKGTTANGGIFAFSNTATRTYTLKDASGTLAFTSDIPSLSGYVQGSGTTNYVSKFTGSGTIGNSQIFDNGTNVGIGTASVSGTYEKLAVAGGISIKDNTNAKLEIGRYNTTGAQNSYIKLGANSNSLRFTNNTDIADIMELTNSGNLGLGVTPSSWANGFTALQVKNASIWSTGNDASFTANAYYDGSNYRYIGSAAATRVYHNIDGSIGWSQSPSGTAGNAISFTQAMTLNANGNLLVGTTSDNGARLQVSGSATIGGNLTVSSGNNLNMVTGDIHFQSNAGYGILSQNGNRLVSIQNGAFGVTGAATFSSSVTANGTATFLGQFGNGNNVNEKVIQFLRASASTDIVNIQGINAGVGAANIAMQALGGNVGIGTSSPDSRLQVNNPTASSTTDALIIQNSGVSSIGHTTGLRFRYNTSEPAAIRAILMSTSTGEGNLAFFTSPNGTGASLTERMTITSSGNVGIGTNTPTNARLVISNSANDKISLDGGSNQNGMRWEAVAGANGFYLFNGTISSSGWGLYNINTAASPFWITNGGNFIIGTTTDNGARLQVNGDILTSAPSGGTAGKWKLGTATSGSYTIGGKIRIEINGVAYDILTT